LSAPVPAFERLSTGSDPLDRILGGGLPVRSVNLVAGEPGAGKTILALQMLFHQARQGKKGLYLTTLSEPSLKVLTYMQQFSFFEESLVASGRVIFADIGSVVRRRGLDETLTEITGRIEHEQPAVVVIDSFKAIRDVPAAPAAVRAFVYDLAVHMSAWGAATLLVGEYTAEEITTLSEFAIADGIVRLSNRRHGLRAIREVEVLKLRGASYVTGGHFFEISGHGLAFFPRVRGPDEASSGPEAPDERAATGAAGFDDMLGGGLPRASSTVVQGGTGTGKTLLALQFLVDGARSGEPGVHFALEETPNQLRRVGRALGWDLRKLEEQGLFTCVYVSPVELSTDWFLDRARQEVARRGARRAVIDSLTSMALSVSERRFKELVYALTKHFRAAGVSVILNMEVADLLGTGQLSGQGISFAADNVIQLKYVEIDGHLERGISVLKARGVRHASDVRRLVIGEGGVDVETAFTGLRGVLTGLPVPAGRHQT
jgi:circadian clock protein KaiC